MERLSANRSGVGPLRPRPGSRLWLPLLLVLCGCGSRGSQAAFPPVADAAQLLVARSPDWNDSRARLQRYERDPDGRWRAVGEAMEAIIGYAGLAWGRGLHGDGAPAGREGPVKEEGDGKSPAGVFALGTVYGYGGAPEGIALPYVAASAGLRCVDDPGSTHYNRIVDAKLARHDWQSAERMRRRDALYELAIVVEHNTAEPAPAAGSCIFLHRWASPDTPVRGCTAMGHDALWELARWLRPGAVMVALPEDEYAALERRWQLP